MSKFNKVVVLFVVTFVAVFAALAIAIITFDSKTVIVNGTTPMDTVVYEGVPVIDTVVYEGTPAPVTTDVVEEFVPQNICDTVVDSSVYAFQEYTLEDGSVLDIPWSDMTMKNIVFQFNLDMMYFEDFSDDMEMFNQYTGMNIRVEDSAYVGMGDEFIIPVNMGNLPSGEWAMMSVMVSASSFLGLTSVSFPSAELVIDQDALGANWEYHNHVVLHEIGHLFGLEHTHGIDGEETDSIMSYNSDYTSIGYLAGDIAGLQEVFCN